MQPPSKEGAGKIHAKSHSDPGEMSQQRLGLVFILLRSWHSTHTPGLVVAGEVSW